MYYSLCCSKYPLTEHNLKIYYYICGSKLYKNISYLLNYIQIIYNYSMHKLAYEHDEKISQGVLMLYLIRLYFKQLPIIKMGYN